MMLIPTHCAFGRNGISPPHHPRPNGHGVRDIAGEQLDLKGAQLERLGKLGGRFDPPSRAVGVLRRRALPVLRVLGGDGGRRRAGAAGGLCGEAAEVSEHGSKKE